MMYNIYVKYGNCMSLYGHGYTEKEARAEIDHLFEEYGITAIMIESED